MTYPTGTYTRNGVSREVSTQADAVSATFDGFTPAEPEVETPEVDETPQVTGGDPETPAEPEVDDVDPAPSQVDETHAGNFSDASDFDWPQPVADYTL